MAVDGIPVEGENPFETAQDDRTPGQQMADAASEPAQSQATAEPAQGGTDQPGQPAGSQAPAPAQGSAWNGEDFALTYRGTRQIPTSKEELINLAQMGFSYSDQMARLKNDRKTLENEFAQYRHFDAMLKQNPQLSQVINDAVAQYQQSQGQGGGNQQAYVPPELLSKISYLEQETQRRAQQEQDRELDSHINSVKQSHPEHDWGQMEKQLLRFAYDNGITNLEHAYRAMMFDNATVNAKAAALKQQQADRVQQTQQGVVQEGYSPRPPAPKSGYEPSDSYDDLTRKMQAEMTG